MLKVFVFFVAVGFVLAYQEQVAVQRQGKRSDEPFYELPCMAAGGICVKAGACPDGELTRSSLCPEQETVGVQCCKTLPKSATTCGSRGGECMSKTTRCPDQLTYTQATDCPFDEKCCILV